MISSSSSSHSLLDAFYELTKPFVARLPRHKPPSDIVAPEKQAMVASERYAAVIKLKEEPKSRSWTSVVI